MNNPLSTRVAGPHKAKQQAGNTAFVAHPPHFPPAAPLGCSVGTANDRPGNEAENLQYYYHPDHLGSTSYITDITGEVYQHLETEERGSRTPIKIKTTVSQYFAFGEMRSIR